MKINNRPRSKFYCKTYKKVIFHDSHGVLLEMTNGLFYFVPYKWPYSVTIPNCNPEIGDIVVCWTPDQMLKFDPYKKFGKPDDQLLNTALENLNKAEHAVITAPPIRIDPTIL